MPLPPIWRRRRADPALTKADGWSRERRRTLGVERGRPPAGGMGHRLHHHRRGVAPASRPAKRFDSEPTFRLRRPTQPRPGRSRPNVSPSLAAGKGRPSKGQCKELTWNRGSGSSSRSASSSSCLPSSAGPGGAGGGPWFGDRVAGPDGADGVARGTAPPSRSAPRRPGGSRLAARGALLRGIDSRHCPRAPDIAGPVTRGASSNVAHQRRCRGGSRARGEWGSCVSELQLELVGASASRVLRFVGELDISTEGPASAETDRARADRPSVVGLDLGVVRVIDPRGFA